MMTMVIVERRPAKDRPEYSFEAKTDEDRGVQMLGVWRGDKIVFAVDLPGKMSAAEIISLGEGLCMIHQKSYEDGLKAMYDKVSRALVQIGRDLYEV